MVHTWRGLFFKEWKMMKGVTIAAFLFALVVFVLPHGLDAADMLDVGLVFIPFYVVYSLNMEANQMYAFLYQPVSANKLFLTKILGGMAFALLFQMIFLLIAFVSMLFSKENGVYLTGYMLYGAIAILIVSLLPAAIFIFAWNIYHWLRSFIGRLSFFLTMILLVLGVSFLINMWDAQWFARLTHWGNVTILPTGLDHFLGELFVSGYFYTGVVVFHAILTFILYGISCWLLDRKVGL